jgi:hypothetical protein
MRFMAKDPYLLLVAEWARLSPVTRENLPQKW